MFHALATGGITPPGCEPEFHYEDVEVLNRRALDGRHDFTKLSFHAWLRVRREYALLRTGAALGFGCGPVVVSRGGLGREDMAGARIAVPGELTTGHLLLRLWAPRAGEILFVPYDCVLDSILEGKADCGVVIHESRFVYRQVGLEAVEDLGEWWETETGLPIPLGCIAARRSLPGEVAASFESALRESILQARKDPVEAMEFARRHAQELDPEILAKHVDTFVNDYSLDLGDEGMAAVRVLERRAQEAGVL
jgi:1,4-dihydroxy-6-naphthoate synthase